MNDRLISKPSKKKWIEVVDGEDTIDIKIIRPEEQKK